MATRHRTTTRLVARREVRRLRRAAARAGLPLRAYARIVIAAAWLPRKGVAL